MAHNRRPCISTTNRVRLFHLHGGLRHICGFEVDSVHQRREIEHVISRGMIGKAADTDENMRPAHARCHKGKTVEDAEDLAKAKRRQAKFHGAFRPARPFPGSIASGLRKRMDGTVERRPS